MTTTNHSTNTIVAVAALCALLALPSLTIAAEAKATPSIEALAEQAASTPAQHEALAAYYRGKADAARAEAERHKEMAVSFPSKGASGMQAHCQALTDAAQKSAAAYDAMAAIHDETAKKATK
jgi:hypothetical protein